MAKRVVVDLDKWRKPDAVPDVPCVYLYHPDNPGVEALLEIASFEHYCRKCELACCIEACPRTALEKDARGVVVRANLRCTGCMSCARACPFGTILEEALRFRAGGCDFCESLVTAEGAGTVPGCVAACDNGALEYREVAPDEGATLVGEKLAVVGRVWDKTDAPRPKARAGAK